ncbi:MAG: response regulator [Verrucomicrobia bacterium]|nr:response regulator [Verrucomicrobiota bacterium]
MQQIFTIVDARTSSARTDWLERVLSTEDFEPLPQNILMTDRSGHERLVAASAAPIHHSSQSRLGTVLVFRDVTIQERMAREMLKASKLESLTLLAGGIAHDFNNILTAVIGNLTLAATFPEDPKQPAWLSEANKASLRARDLTQQLLTFAKGGVPLKKTARLQETIRESTQFALHGANVRAVFALPENLWAAEADTGQLSQVIHNLVLNAVQAMPGGGDIQVRAENLQLAAESSLPLPGGNYVRISIQDQGGGIEPAHLPRIFDPFFTTKRTGSGLGLATCYSIIQKHHGHITLDSQLGSGTTFHIYLPASDKPAPLAEAACFSPPARGAGRLLVMEDDPALRTCIHSMLDRLGYEVCIARNSEETLSSYRATRHSHEAFDAVILDLTIRGGGGARETLEKLRAEEPGIKAIVSTGYANNPAVEDYRQLGFSGVITKPYTLEQLATVLKHVLPANGNEMFGSP